MAKQEFRFTFDSGKELGKLIDQRAAQEGISVSEYIREAIILKMVLSGDLEAMKYVATRVGKRVKEALLEKVAGGDLKDRVEVLEVS